MFLSAVVLLAVICFEIFFGRKKKLILLKNFVHFDLWRIKINWAMSVPVWCLLKISIQFGKVHFWPTDLFLQTLYPACLVNIYQIAQDFGKQIGELRAGFFTFGKICLLCNQRIRVYRLAKKEPLLSPLVSHIYPLVKIVLLFWKT